MKDVFSINSIKGVQVLINLSLLSLRLYLNFSSGIIERTSLTQCLNDGGLTDFHCIRINLLAISVRNAMAFICKVVKCSSEGAVPKMAITGSGSTVTPRM